MGISRRPSAATAMETMEIERVAKALKESIWGSGKGVAAIATTAPRRNSGSRSQPCCALHQSFTPGCQELQRGTTEARTITPCATGCLQSQRQLLWRNLACIKSSRPRASRKSPYFTCLNDYKHHGPISPMHAYIPDA